METVIFCELKWNCVSFINCWISSSSRLDLGDLSTIFTTRRHTCSICVNVCLCSKWRWSYDGPTCFLPFLSCLGFCHISTSKQVDFFFVFSILFSWGSLKRSTAGLPNQHRVPSTAGLVLHWLRRGWGDRLLEVLKHRTSGKRTLLFGN